MEVDLAGRLRAETRVLHAQVERSPFVARLLAGQTDRAAYCLLLRNLHPIYLALEEGAARLSDSASIAQLFAPGLARLAALEADLDFLAGPDWRQSLRVLPAAAAYGHRLNGLGPARAHLLAAHAYVRYLGDMAGGQQLRGIVARSLHLPVSEGTAFYAFGAPDDVRRQVQAFRQGLNRCAAGPGEAQDIVDEARLSFEMHHALFTELEAARTEPGSGAEGAATR
ncbi:heme oxygenase (biliverdin-producing) [Ramlibacter sp.]|uniref:biliverdin-producing heme oxygenase n=1 Tax=Ramlibacter sp. TaxID=1917967 RepID=UPI003D10BB03